MRWKKRKAINGVCARCGLGKTPEEFGFNRDPLTMESHPLNYVCKTCVKERAVLGKREVMSEHWTGLTAGYWQSED